jgi:hypothetical protein
MAEFPGAADEFVLLKMESDERQPNKMHAGLEDRLVCLMGSLQCWDSTNPSL